jgi:Fe-S oxidoreductase
MFQESKCDLCGDCLVECQYVDYSREKAVEEIKALISGRPADILSQCVTCIGCNENCPQDADPFDLIITSIAKMQPFMVPPQTFEMFGQAAGLPSMVVPGANKKQVLSLCALEPMLPPNLAAHPAFTDLTVAKGGDYFCYLGTIHLLMGDSLPAKGRALVDRLAALNAEEVIFVHDECYAMVAQKSPEYGIEVPFKSRHILEYLNSYLKENSSKVRPLGRKIAYQRPCSSRFIPNSDEMVDEFLELVGVERVARKFDRKSALCCGAAVMGTGRLAVAMESQMKNLADAQENGAQAMGYICPICGMMLGEICQETQFPAHSLFELFLEATA